ncbi:MAG: hypothetical protein IPG71_02910 [bacterium]|nr:hypothetical protein [bacterium]
MYKVLILAIVSLFPALSLAQARQVTVSQEELALFAGEWYGTIMFEDDISHEVVAVPGHMTIRDAGDGLSTTVTYTKPDGTPVAVDDMIRPSHGGRRLLLDGKVWMLDGKVHKEEVFGISFQGPGSGNLRNVQFLYQMSLSTPLDQPTDSLMFTKRVLEENAGVPKTSLAFRLGRMQ